MIYHLQVYKKQLILKKNIIYDDCEQIYDLIEVSTGDIVYSANEVIDFEKYDPDTLNISDTEAAKRTADDIRKIINIIEENSTKED